APGDLGQGQSGPQPFALQRCRDLLAGGEHGAGLFRRAWRGVILRIVVTSRNHVFTIPANMFELTNVSAECTVWNMGSLFRTGERVLPGSTYRAVAIVTITIIAVALSYGAISAVSGFAWWQTLLLAVFALGGAAEFTFVGVLAAGGAPIFPVLAGLLANSPPFAFGPFFPQDWRALIASLWINDESTAISRTGRNDRARWHAFLLMGAAIALMWPSGAMVGQWLGNVIDADLLGLDAAFPIILFCLIRGDLKNRATLSLTVAGILIA